MDDSTDTLISTRVRHLYVSEGCTHDNHLECKLDCSYCGQICNCSCHLAAE